MKKIGRWAGKNNPKYIHGKVGTHEYWVWSAMKGRCNNPKNKGYKNYGKRGISVCNKWNKSFANFISDMGPRPKGYELDRIDNDGNYEPKNCRWTTKTVQQNNRRKNWSVNGEKKRSMKEIADEYGIGIHCLYARVLTRKMSLKDAVAKKVEKKYAWR